MRLDLFEGGHGATGPLSRRDARGPLLVTLAFVVLVVATPAGSWTLLGIEGLALAVVVGISGLSPRRLLRRWLGFVALVGFLAAMLALSRPRDAAVGPVAFASAVIVKNSLAFVAMMTLAGITPFPRLLQALGRLGVPPVLLATLHFMHRYLFVLTDELGRMIQARRARNFRRSGRLDWGLLTGLIGVLFLRAMERGERVHAAMLARGWDGNLRTLDGADPA